MRLDVLARCAPARAVVLQRLADAFRAPAEIGVAEWAEASRVVSAESGSRNPGKWRNDRSPHLVGVMDALGPDDPAEDVVFVASAQVGKSEVGQNFFGWVVDAQPGPMLIVLPSTDEAQKYVRTKLQPTIDETPALRGKVLEQTSRTEKGSTASFKKFRGGYAQITFAGSSKGLQMLTARFVIGEEVSEWPAEAGKRGDPVTQTKKRTETYERERKRFWPSTPSVLGACRITQEFEKSDKRRRYLPCPCCGAYQVLTFDRLKHDSESWPHGAYFECAAEGCRIEHLDKPAMLAAGEWIATAGEDGPGEWFPASELEHWKSRHVPGRIRGFHIWKAYSTFSSWGSIIAEWLDAKDKPQEQKTFTQQVLGEAYEEKGEAPDAELLLKQRVLQIARGAPPVGPLVYTGATDVQGNRLEWAVWGWSEGMTRWLVDWGVIEGDPTDLAVWAEHDRIVTTRRYSAGGAVPQEVEAWAVDSGYHSHAVYNYTRRRPGLFAVDGREGRFDPFMGTPRKVDVQWNGKRVRNGAVIWPAGNYALKSDLYGSIRKTIAGQDEHGAWAPGSMILPGEVDLAYCEQLTAEFLKRVESRSGVATFKWAKLQGRPNEALDIACYARAMAYHLGLDRLSFDQWRALRAERGAVQADSGQGDLFAVNVSEAVAPPAAPQKRRRRRRGLHST